MKSLIFAVHCLTVIRYKNQHEGILKIEISFNLEFLDLKNVNFL